MFRVCMAGSYPEQAYQQLREALPDDLFEIIRAESQQEFEQIVDADAVVLRILKMDKETFTRFNRLKLVVRWGVGYESVDIEEAGRRGIRVCNTPGANAYAVAELAVAMMIALNRNLLGYIASTRQNLWNREAFSSTSLNGKLVGVVGGGNIGRQVALRVSAFGAMVQYFDVFRLNLETEKQFGMAYVKLDTLLQTSDVVSLHLPFTDGTRHIIGSDQLAMMKQSAILINTARGGLVDDTALAQALAEGRIAAAGIDCVEDDRGQATELLCGMPNVIVTPHIGGTTNDLITEILPMIVQNIVEQQGGLEVSHIVNREYLPKA